ncbi:hypothetical protein M3Y95_00794600 [Aphelenchoides besseyi]|nr:hypothetical protein M3Y95_00794600 [Aphelenchoides besseyi]
MHLLAYCRLNVFVTLLCFLQHSTAVIRTIPPSTTTTTTTTPDPRDPRNKPEHIDALVDRIEAIDVSSTQVIIQTSKIGPAENAKVSIDIIDLNSGEKLPPMNLHGILLVITRGRYTINFLKPNTWYGIAFRCEQQPMGPNGPIYIDSEEHLVKTHKEDGSNLDAEPIVTIFTKRSGADGKSMENLVNNLNTAANVTLHCDEHLKYKQVVLDHHDVEKSVEVKLDNNFEVLELHNNSRQIMASITPKHCNRICWVAELYADAFGFHFQRDVAKECEQIETVTAHAVLRDYLSYEMKDNSLTVHTNYSDEEKKHLERDAYVQLTAIPLPENNRSKDHTAVRYKVFSTAHNTDSFTLDGLEASRFYAVQYTYGKQSPFAYAESRRFIVETRPSNGHSTAKSAARPPIQLHFQRPKRPIANLKAKAETSKPKNLTETENETTKPGVSARLDPTYRDYQLGMDVEPFCRDKNGTHFWLSADRPEYELKKLNVEEAVCSAHPENFFCPNQTTTKSKEICIPNLCYTASLVVRSKVYQMERRCVNVANQYPPSQHRRESGASKTSLGLIVLFVVLCFQF